MIQGLLTESGIVEAARLLEEALNLGQTPQRLVRDLAVFQVFQNLFSKRPKVLVRLCGEAIQGCREYLEYWSEN